MQRILFMLILASMTTWRALSVPSTLLGADTDGDGLLDLIDASGFDPDAAGAVTFALQGIQDLDGAAQLDNIRSLNLAFNRVSSIERGDFQGLDRLRELDLAANTIMNLDNGGFQGLVGLVTISLNSNAVSHINGGAFLGLDNLKTLKLSENAISNIQNGTFQGLDNLHELRLNENSISSLAGDGFKELKNLRWLDLDDNMIASIESRDFLGLENLQSLSLAFNRLSSLESGAFQEMDNLSSLSLAFNRIAHLTTSDFHGLDHLQSLSLDHNAITSLDQNLFESLGHLIRLSVTNNAITNVKRGAFQGLGGIQFLFLDGNAITRIERGAFRGLANLRSLHIKQNALTELSFEGATLMLDALSLDRDDVSSLVLDDATLSAGSFRRIVAETNSLIEISLVGLKFFDENPDTLNDLLSIGPLDNVTINRSLMDVYADELNAFDAIDGNTVTVVPDIGDYNANGLLDAADLDLQAAALQTGHDPEAFELTYDGRVDVRDRIRWVEVLRNSVFGDWNLDGQFETGDLTHVLALGKFENGGPADWNEGDSNGDGVFDSADLVLSLERGRYEQGPRMTVRAVPEPMSFLLFISGGIGVSVLGRMGGRQDSSRRFAGRSRQHDNLNSSGPRNRARAEWHTRPSTHYHDP